MTLEPTFAADALDLSRVQFALTSLYHFIFVPLTLGLAPFVALMQTRWYRTGDERWLRLTRFFGTLLLINFAIGAATGLVQEFQFGMNWSSFSTFVGDAVGPAIAIEGLGAFFLESTFLGLWVFGWFRLSPKMHLVTIYLVWLATWASGYFIIAFNSWMQHPIGYDLNRQTGRAEATNFIDILFQGFAVFAWVHVILAGLMVGAFLVLGVSCWHLWRKRNVELFGMTAKLAVIVAIPVSLLNLAVGSEFGVAVTDVQPMKISATEALWKTEQPAAFSLIQIGGFSQSDQTPSFDIEVPRLLSLLSTNSLNGKVVGINKLQKQAVAKYGPGNYIPDVELVYWSMRAMAYLGSLSAVLAIWGGWLVRKRRLEGATWFHRAAVVGIALPFLSAFAGWILTETGRQPWVVYGLLKTADAVSPSVSTTTAALSLGSFALLYIVLGLLYVWLMRRHARLDPPEVEAEDRAQPSVPAAGY